MADERDELIAELRAQFERMKCCANCRYNYRPSDQFPCIYCVDMNNWEPRNG